MTSIHFLTLVAIATAIVSGAAVARPVQATPDQTHARAEQNVPFAQADRHGDARDDRREHRDDRRLRSRDGHGYRANPALLPVVTGSLPDQAAYGWQYFTDPRAAHAVVISPRGEYYVSLGGGLRQITGPTGQPTNN